MNKKPINSNPTKEFFQLLKTIEKTTKNQAKIKSYNPDDISSFIVEICPKKGLYQFAKFLFQIQLFSYPREFPNVICLSDIYHPNIEHGEGYHNVCLNLFDNWNRSFGLIDVIQGLIFLLYQPNLSDPISSFFNNKNTNYEIFRRNVYTSLRGGTIDGINFLPNPGLCEINSENVVPKEIDGSEKEKPENCDDYPLKEESEEKCLESKVEDEIEPEVEKEVTNEKLENDEVNGLMTNNNAAQQLEIVSEPASEKGDEDSTYNSDEDKDLPIRDVISPNAFYSDLICSRYAQPDMVSDSEYDSSQIWHASIICDYFDYPSSSYVSDFDESNYFYHDWEGEDDDDEDDEDDTNYDEDDDSDSDYRTENRFISVPTNQNDPSYIFLKKWVDMRRNLNISNQCPKPMSIIVLKNVLNPFRNIFSTFFLCNPEDRVNNWQQSYGNTVYRVNGNDRTLHLMFWAQNLSRWAMKQMYKVPLMDWAFDNIFWYTVFVGLRYKINQKLFDLYDCKEACDSVCVFVE